MTYDEKPPIPGLTRRDTGVPEGHPYLGWFVEPWLHDDIMARVDARQGVAATTDGPHLSRKAVHRDTAPTEASKGKAKAA